jgi:hypothetical protein
VTPTPIPDYGAHMPAGAPTTWVDWLLGAFLIALAFGSYWLPTILALWRRNSRMGLVIFYNLAAFMVFPWVGAMGVVLGEHSHRVRPPMWTPPPAEWQGPAPEQPAATPPSELPPNVTQIRRGRGAQC